MMRILYFLFTILLIACNENKQSTIQTPPVESEPLSYLALGDSYTIGESVDEAERYPNQLAIKLRETEINIQDPKIIATTGWRTDQLMAAIENENLENNYDLVSLLIGVNNQFQGKSIEVYKAEFRQLLETAIELAKGNKNHVFVVSIPDYAFTPYGQANDPNDISEGVDQFNTANKVITQEMGVQYFNITPISRKGVEEPELVATDGLHPSGEQYKRWVESFFEEIKEILEN